MSDQQYMQLALNEASKGVGRTAPNPAVGAVIVKNGHVLGAGYHKKAGTPHAEIHALNATSTSLDQATIYVTLEPCSHTGKTPPCCEAIARTGISRVVIGMTDPNPLVNGRGISYLRNKGIEVVAGVLQEECEAINLPWIKYIKNSMPYMVMKAGISLDGRLNYQHGVSGWITGEQSAKKVHQLRDTYDSIMVGSRTILADNPSLTTRLNGEGHRHPTRIILDTHLSTPVTAKVYNQEQDGLTIVICANEVADASRKIFEDKGVRILAVSAGEGGLNLKEVLRTIAGEGICSVLVEGGSVLHGSLLREEYYDFAYLFLGPVFAGDSGQGLAGGVNVASGTVAPRIACPRYEQLGEDMLVKGKIIYPPVK